MPTGYPLSLDATQWGVVAFVLAMAFLSGVLGGYLFGLTHAVRQGSGNQAPRSIWTCEDED